MDKTLKAQVSTLSTKPGVYQFFNRHGKLLYVGKARHLRKRVASYFREDLPQRKTAALMAQVAEIKTIITASDTEALLLESNLIKTHRPRYNILLRDDKSYPYLYLSTHQTFPRLDFYRGTKRGKGRYFGPFPSAGALRENLALLQKLFRLRQCKDSFFRHRSRPCLQYQIKRCTAPCVGLVTEKAYAEQVAQTELFLGGKSDVVLKQLEKQMDDASRNQAYETAAVCRDQILQLRRLQAEQCITGKTANIDIVAVALGRGVAVLNLAFVRSGRLIGQKQYTPKTPLEADIPAVLSAFLPQYYLNALDAHDSIDKIVLSDKFPEKHWLQAALSDAYERKIVVTDFQGAIYKQWQTLAKVNAQHALDAHARQQDNALQKLADLQLFLGLSEKITRIECFDVSHTQGEATVASCVVYGLEGPMNKAYRRFNIQDVTPGDDYAAMEQALLRRYTRLKSAGKSLPDVIVIDGGKGQLHAAEGVLEELQLTEICLISISKGPARKPGQEQIWFSGQSRARRLQPDSNALHLLQFVRDESHRFAITAHRRQRGKARTESPLEQIPGVGLKRRQAMLRHFGGMQEVLNASVTDLAKVPGISESLAKLIFEHLH